MGRTLKQSGAWERNLYRQAIGIADCGGDYGRALRKYDREPRLYINVKHYSGFPDSLAAAVMAEYGINSSKADTILEAVYEWHGEQFWEDADECARYCLLGDESGALQLHTKEWSEKSIIVSGGRSDGWLSVKWGPLDECAEYESDRRLTRDERRKFLKFARQSGSAIDYLLSTEAVMETIACNVHVWSIISKADRESEQYRAEFADATCGAD